MKFHLYRGGESLELLADAAESEEVKVDAIVKGIPHESFMSWQNLRRVQLPEGLQIIEQGAFAYCTSLLEIHLPSTVKVLHDMVFVDCTSLTTVWLSDAIQVLEQSLFENCLALQEIHMPLHLMTIKDSCFASCRSLPSLLLPFGLEKIGDWAFARCESMTSLSVPSTVTHVGRYCFQQCYELLSLEFPQGLTFMGDHCFVDCSNLRSMVIPRTFEFAGSYPLLDRSLLKASFTEVEHDTYEDETLVNRLSSRFDHLPIHNACYHLYQVQPQGQSTDHDAADHSLIHLEELLVDRARIMATSESAMEEHSLSNYRIHHYSSSDGFKMNPLHLLCLSGIPNPRACQLLLKHATAWNENGKKAGNAMMKMLQRKDTYGDTPFTYLCWNRAPGTKEFCEAIFRVVVSTTRLPHIRLDGWKQSITDAMNYALEHWDEAPAQPQQQQDETTTGGALSSRLELVGRVIYAMKIHERKESMSLLELWLWKMQMNLVVYDFEKFKREGDQHHQRQECRIQCGADVVIPNVLSFLRPLKEGQYLKAFIRMHSRRRRNVT